MRRLIVVLSMLATSVFAEQMISADGSEVSLYTNAKRGVNETPATKASGTETFAVVKRQGNMIQVRNSSGQELWAEARALKVFNQAQGASMDLGAGKIDGFLDNPATVYVLQEETSAMAGLDLQRSFIEAVQGNMDREVTERKNSENR
ncbi:MAG TPA: hypothetical protein PKO15_08640 [Fibrobacteria bacterium]|mgnify:CR=1 FL=1|nr:hypothetical protein [Fibrobacteria bacterium]HOX53432.1 hypothetical protein [Fibrobacteria bacterium]